MAYTHMALEAWMSSNRLRFNSAKTQFIWVDTCQQLAKLDMSALAAAFPNFTFSSSVRDLGVTLDRELIFASHINLLSRDCFYQLRQLLTVARSCLLIWKYQADQKWPVRIK